MPVSILKETYHSARDLSHFQVMYTEGELKDQKQSSPPSPLIASVTHGSEAPQQPSPEVLPPASASHSSPMSQLPSSAPISFATGTTSVPSPPQQQQQQLPQTLPTQLQKGEQHQGLYTAPQHHHHSLQQQQQIYRETESHHNSDSDSSSAFGVEGNRRYREFVPEEQKDSQYWEKRRKNNEAARRSREKRRIHDRVLEGRINILEDDNSKLRRELLALKRKFNLPDEQAGVEDSMDDEPVTQKGNLSPHHVPNNGIPSHTSPVGGAPKPPGHAHMPYSSPPPLLAVSSAMHMGVAMYSNNSSGGLPYFLSEAASRAYQEGTIRPQVGMPSAHYHYHLTQHQLPPQHPAYHPMDLLKHEPIEEGEIRSRERSNSNVERRSASYHLESPDSSLFRRGSVGNYNQYRSPVSPPIPAQSAYHSGHAPYMQTNFDSYSRSSWSQASPVTSHSSDNEEPLQLTVRRDSNVSGRSNNGPDDSSVESEHSVTPAEKTPTSVSPPASSFPLKLRHKLPNHDASYAKDSFSSLPSSAVTVTPAPYSSHPFMNGLAQLSDINLAQSNPLSLSKSDSPAMYRHRKDRSGSRRAPGDIKYLDPKYLERRRRNNEAARKCRENRKTLTKIREAKSDYLETENSKLRDELTSLQEEMKQLRELIEKKRLEQGIKDEPNSES
ncbi:uncharacterized protein LOC106059678 isoform X2 [Biomphalaria glabrata]|uniref:Uncharacterized protein LOC106059678 isoform X2 n=1 Tax=Biomphalaria glabrata TaxID=6526 RepID=A0A9W3AAZ4_BIOGL|nr:uncharacterized protein LOC106059678 isoform X2 [Biomphalaria glabrata]